MKYFAILLFFLLGLNSQNIIATSGGNHTYKFLSLTNSPRVASLGGKLIAIKDDDVSLPYYNPSLLNASMNNHLALNYINYFAGINFGYASYARTIKGIGNVSAGIHYINYGEFTAADETGLITGTFKAGEYAINMFWSRQLDSSFSVGVNFKPIMSFLEKYSSYGFATDLGITYQSDDKLFTAALVFRNIGSQLKAYNRKVFEPLPFEILLGGSIKLRHAPFRICFTGHQLQTLDLTYEKEEETTEIQTSLSESLDTTEKKIDQITSSLGDFADQFLRHTIIGVEMPLIENNIYLRFGYNYKRRQELGVSTKMSTVGFSWGFGLRISKIFINYGRANYHLAGPSNHFSIRVNLADFYTSSPE